MRIYQVFLTADTAPLIKEAVSRLGLQDGEALSFNAPNAGGLVSVVNRDGEPLKNSFFELLKAAGVSHDAVAFKEHDSDRYTDFVRSQFRLTVQSVIYKPEASALESTSITDYQRLRLAAFACDKAFLLDFFSRSQDEDTCWSFYNWLLDDEVKGDTLPSMEELYRYRYKESLSQFSSELEGLIDQGLSPSVSATP